MSASPTSADRFWKSVNKDGPIIAGMNSKCWEWTGHLTSGYGHFHVGPGNKLCYAHRFSWSLHTGDVLRRSDHICHKCDNPKCVNPEHLFKGDATENMRDMIEKGRKRTACRKITEAAAVEIFNSRGVVPDSVLAKRFSVTRSAISHVWTGHTWSRVTGAQRNA